MKNLARCFVMFIFIGVGSNVYAQEWIPYQEHIQPVVQTQVEQNVIVEQQRLFCRTQTVINRPSTQWVLQPVVIYR